MTVSQVHDELFKELAARFGTEALAIRVDANAGNAMTNVDTRQNDKSPFYGGADLYQPSCSDAFAWVNGSLWEGMLTAAHCAPTVNFTVLAESNHTMGHVGYENWVNGDGTVPYPGQTALRGDVAF